jgi:hypothetical protein
MNNLTQTKEVWKIITRKLEMVRGASYQEKKVVVLEEGTRADTARMEQSLKLAGYDITEVPAAVRKANEEKGWKCVAYWTHVHAYLITLADLTEGRIRMKIANNGK